MIINCICGKKKFRLADELMPSEGSKVRCGSCSEVWFYHPNQGNLGASDEGTSSFEETYSEKEDLPGTTPENPPPDENFTVDEVDASISETQDNSLESKENLKTFKIFTDEDADLPSKEEMDKNLDNYKIERDQNLNFFQRIFKKDRMRDAADALEKQKKDEISEEEEKSNQARRTRLLFYLLILLLIVFSVTIVPMRDDIAMAFPFMKGYLEFLIPVYDYIKGPLSLN